MLFTWTPIPGRELEKGAFEGEHPPVGADQEVPGVGGGGHDAGDVVDPHAQAGQGAIEATPEDEDPPVRADQVIALWWGLVHDRQRVGGDVGRIGDDVALIVDHLHRVRHDRTGAGGGGGGAGEIGSPEVGQAQHLIVRGLGRCLFDPFRRETGGRVELIENGGTVAGGDVGHVDGPGIRCVPRDDAGGHPITRGHRSELDGGIGEDLPPGEVAGAATGGVLGRAGLDQRRGERPVDADPGGRCLRVGRRLHGRDRPVGAHRRELGSRVGVDDPAQLRDWDTALAPAA